MTVFYKTCLIPLVIALFKVFNSFARIFGTFKAISQSIFLDTVLYFTFSAMLRLSFIAVQATGTGLFMVTVLVANFTIHSARGQHTCINVFFRHFHKFRPFL